MPTIFKLIKGFLTMAWENVKLPFGIVNGRLKHIDDVPNGRACACICPKCNRALEARNAGTIRAHYFAHYDSDECTGATETAIHLMAKQIITDTKTIQTPIFERTPKYQDIEGSYYYGKPIKIEAKLVEADHANPEERRHGYTGYTPDITLTLKSKYLLVEIRVTHEVDFEKMLKVEHHDEAMMEVDLSKVDPAMLFELRKFEQYVIHDAPRKWINNPKGNALYKNEMERLQPDVEKINIDLRRKRKEHDEKQKQEKADRLSYELRRTQEREKHIDQLNKLEIYLSPIWQTEQEQKQLQNTLPSDVLKIKNAEQAHGLNRLIDIQVKNAWIFKAHKSIWQAYILNTLFNLKQSNKNINASWVKNLVVSKFGILDEILNLHNLKKEYKKIGKERNKWYGNSGCWFFTEQENRKIPSPFQPIIEYLNHLENSNVIQRINNYEFCIIIQNLNCYITEDNDYRKKQEELIQKAIAKQLAEAEKARAEKKAQEEANNQLLAQQKIRQKELMASEQRVFECFEGNGRLCRKCYFTSHETDGDICPFCGNNNLEKLTISSYLIEKAIYRYDCNGYPSISIRVLPKITDSVTPITWTEKPIDL